MRALGAAKGPSLTFPLPTRDRGHGRTIPPDPGELQTCYPDAEHDRTLRDIR